MSDSVQPHGLQPTRPLGPWDSPGKNTGVGCHFLLQCMKVESESETAQSCPTLSDPWTAAHQAPPSMGTVYKYITLTSVHTVCTDTEKSENTDIKLLAMLLLTSLSGSLESSCIR